VVALCKTQLFGHLRLRECAWQILTKGENPRITLNTMANKLLGRFYFKQTSNGNLIGEFSNNLSAEISTESCDLKGASSGYVGQYKSTWQENRKPLFANLVIAPNTANSRLFSLIWRRGGKPIFEGAGMLCDDILVGDYHDV
jgi:hypothetical protein